MSTVRLSKGLHQTLRDLAHAERLPLQTVVERAVEQYRRQRFLEAANEQYARLRADKAGWKKERREREVWDRTLRDGNG